MIKQQIQVVFCTSRESYKNLFKQSFLFLLKRNKLTNLFIREVSLKKNKIFTLLRSPHVFKNARNQFEIESRTTILVVSHFTFFELERLILILKFLLINIPAQSSVKIKRFVVLRVEK